MAGATLQLASLVCVSATGQHLTGARDVALSRATTAVRDLHSLESNPAAGSAVGASGFGLDAAQLYNMPELRTASAHLSMPVLGTSVTFGARTFGFELYRKTDLILTLARGFRPGTFREIHFGVRLRESLVQFDRYGRLAYPTASAGLLIPVAGRVTLGATASNLIAFGEPARMEAERSLSLGISYSDGRSVTIASDLFKEVRSPASTRVGVEVHPVPALSLRGGVTMEPPRLTAGVGLRLSRLRFDAAAEKHHALGWSPYLSIRVLW